MRKKRFLFITVAAALLVIILFFGFLLALRAAYPRPYGETVERSGLHEELVYSVIKAESGFREGAISKAGAVGLMQLMPATAEFVCGLEKIPFEAERLTEGEYNAMLGCAYLKYLFGRFGCEETALCAYNAGEGTVAEWLKNSEYSSDGERLIKIPYRETAEYVRKIAKYKKVYKLLY